MVSLINKHGLSEHKHCDNVVTNANSENARSRMEASSAGNREYRGKGRWVKYWARLGCWISPCYGLFSLGGCFETYKLFISLIFQYFLGHSELWITETVDTESTDMGTHLYLYWKT
jgi:hypothetical protein